ncbi:hypothetical protein NFI96_005564, partial [Prochilodus magdalenae]
MIIRYPWAANAPSTVCGNAFYHLFQRPVGSVLWSSVLWGSVLEQCPVGQCPVTTDEGLEDDQHCTLKIICQTESWQQRELRQQKDSTDSDDSVDGRRPDLSAEERSLPDDLLENSNAFIRLYEEHQPGLQKIISDLEGSSERFLDRYEKAARLSVTGGVAAAAGLGAAVLTAPYTFGFSLLAVGLAAAAGTIAGVVGNRIKGQEESKALEDVKNAVEIFNTRAKTVTSYLNNVCDQLRSVQSVSRLYQFKRSEPPGPSCASMKSDWSMHRLPHFREDTSATDL